MNKAWIIGAACAAALLGAPAAQAQDNDLSGTWGFHTADYSPNPEFQLRMSGVAEIQRSGAGRYAITLMTQEAATQGQQIIELWSHQDCVGSVTGDQATITCTVVTAGQEGYVADNFQLTIAGDGASMQGHLASASSAPVIFRKLR